MKNKKILYIVSNDKFFITHRIPVALQAKKLGYEIHLATIRSTSNKYLNSLGIFTHKLCKKNTENKFILLISSFLNTLKIVKKINPNIIQIITIFNILSSGFALLFTRQKNIIFSVSGLGFIFTDNKFFTKLVKFLITKILFLIFFIKQPKVIFQNKQDYNDLDKHNILIKKNVIFIKGSGVDTKKYFGGNNNFSRINILFASRLLIHKGIVEFLEAAELVKKDYRKINFIVAGKIDTNNPSFINKNTLLDFQKKNVIKYVGYCENIRNIFKKTSILVLPSYREGTPKIIIEALSYGIPVIASKISGCETIIKHRKNGILVPVKNSKALASAIIQLSKNKKLMNYFKKRGRLLAKKELDIKLVINKHLKIYNQLIKLYIK